MTRNIKTTKNIKQDKSHKIESYISKEHKRMGDKIIMKTKKTREEQIKWNKNVKDNRQCHFKYYLPKPKNRRLKEK